MTSVQDMFVFHHIWIQIDLSGCQTLVKNDVLLWNPYTKNDHNN